MFRNIWAIRSGRFAILIIGVAILLVAFGPLLAPYDPLEGSELVLSGPSFQHPFGTDYLGRDTLSRLLAGAPLSIVSAVQVGVIGLVVGAVPGVLSVYSGRVFEWVTLRLIDTLIALPFLVFAVAVTALLGNALTQAMLVVGVLTAPAFYRVARASTLAVANSPYVEAAQLAGADVSWIVRKHVTGKVLPPLAITLASTLGVGLIAVAALSFLGIGVQPPAPTWGGMLASDLKYLTFRPFAPIIPSIPIIVLVWAFNMLADVIRDVSGESGRQLLARSRRRRGLAPKQGV
ncbi:ABC transporter permease (plasmid) [Rhodococcus globerulus]|uniref:ABC transporter permease n=1 Tax=Rhodococcus globerulus TaxID=33008 RepID=UPI0039EB40C8